MSKYFTDSEEIQKAIVLLEYVNGKLASLSKRINTVYSTLNEQQNSTVKNAHNSIKVQGIIYDDQMKNIVEIAGFLQATLNESLTAQEAAKKIMESEIKPSGEEQKPGNNSNQSNGSPSTNTQVNAVLKKYQNNAHYNWKPDGNRVEDYSDFQVLKGFKYEYCMDQRIYEAKLGLNGACVGVADCIAGSIKKGYKIEPTLNDFDANGAAYWTYTDVVPGTRGTTINEQCREIYRQIMQGNPVMIRVDDKHPLTADGHSVTAIGLRAGTTINNITPADILVVDPGDGKIKTADQIYYGRNETGIKMSMQDNIDWSLGIPK